MTAPATKKESCVTCVGRRGPHMACDVRRITLDAFRLHLEVFGTEFKCHESGRAETCAAFYRFKLARELRGCRPSLEEITCG